MRAVLNCNVAFHKVMWPLNNVDSTAPEAGLEGS